MPRPMLLKHKIINSDLFADPERIRVVTVICCLILAFPSAQIFGVQHHWDEKTIVWSGKTFYHHEAKYTKIWRLKIVFLQLMQ